MKIKIKSYEKQDIMRILREWTGLTQKEFAKQIGKSVRTVQGYEEGLINYNIDTILKIIKVFNMEMIIEKN